MDLDILRVKYVNKCQLLKNVISLVPSLVPFSISWIRFLSSALELLYDWQFTGAEPLETNGQKFFYQLNTCGNSPFKTSSRTGGWVCNLQLLLAQASALILGSDSRGTRDHILLSQIRDFPFCCLYESQGHGGGIRLRLHTGGCFLQNHIATDDQSISKSWCRTPSGAHDQIFITV
jgi:hypothetical protein